MLHDLRIGQVMSHLGGDDDIKGVIRERQGADRPDNTTAMGAQGQRGKASVQAGDTPVPVSMFGPTLQLLCQRAVAGAQIEQSKPARAFASQPADEQSLEWVGHEHQPIEATQLPIIVHHGAERKVQSIAIFCLRGALAQKHAHALYANHVANSSQRARTTFARPSFRLAHGRQATAPGCPHRHHHRVDDSSLLGAARSRR